MRKVRTIRTFSNIFSVMSAVLGINFLGALSDYIEISMGIRVTVLAVFLANVCFTALMARSVNDLFEQNIMASWKRREK